MKLSLISEIQYKEADTFMQRVGSTGSRLVGSVNDLYHKKKKPKHSAGKSNSSDRHASNSKSR